MTGTVKGGTYLRNTQPKPKNDAADDEQRNLVSNGDHHDSKEHDHAADDDTEATATDVCYVGYDGNSEDGADGHGRCEETERRSFGVVVR